MDILISYLISMRKLFSIIILSLIFAVAAIAKDWSDDDIPLGMEAITINNVRYIVPKGTKIKKNGKALSLESRDEYISRRFQTMDSRLRILEKNEGKLRSDIVLLKGTIDRLRTELRNQEVNPKSFDENKLRSDIMDLFKGVIDKLQTELQQQGSNPKDSIEIPE